jgi:hypothetical protein
MVQFRSIFGTKKYLEDFFILQISRPEKMMTLRFFSEDVPSKFLAKLHKQILIEKSKESSTDLYYAKYDGAYHRDATFLFWVKSTPLDKVN